jgi:hypothetical protein
MDGHKRLPCGPGPGTQKERRGKEWETKKIFMIFHAIGDLKSTSQGKDGTWLLDERVKDETRKDSVCERKHEIRHAWVYGNGWP